MNSTIDTLKEQTKRVNKFFGAKVFEIGQRNGFKYFDYCDHNKPPLFNSAKSNKDLSENISAFYEGLIFKGSKTYHFICTVKDSINNYREVVSIYCDVSTFKEAEEHFKQHELIKKYTGNERYQIIFRQNATVIQG